MRFLVGVMLLCVLSVPLLNYVIDPYDVFHSGWITTPSVYTNDRYNKTQVMLAQPRKAVWLMGSSVVAQVPPAVFPGDSVLNMGLIAARANEHLALLKVANRHGRLPREAYLGIDVFPFVANESLDDPTDPQKEPNLTFLHPPVTTGQSPWQHGLTYLFAASAAPCFDKVINHGTTEFVYHYAQGYYQQPRIEEHRRHDRAGYLQKAFGGPIRDVKPRGIAVERFRHLMELQDWATAHHLKLVLYYQPLHPLRLAHFTPEFVTLFKNQLQQKTGLQPIEVQDRIPQISDNTYWVDTKHHQPELARLIYGQVRELDRLATAGLTTPAHGGAG